MEGRRGLDAFTLKIAMAALMVLDHLYFFLPGAGFPIWFTMAGRLVAPTFCYLMTQSLYHTRDKSRYLRRLTAAGLGMFAGNLLIMLLAAILKDGEITPLGNSIFLSLAVSATLVNRLERLRQEGFSAKDVGMAALMLLLSLLVEGAFLLPVMAVIFYFLRDRKVLMSAIYLTGSSLAVYLMMGLSGPNPSYTFEVLGFSLHTQYLQAFALIPILLYDGSSGPRNAFSKWFFYLFYPLHVWIFYLVGALG